MTRPLRTPEEIRAAGAAAVADFPPLTDRQVDQMAALLSPVRDEVWRPLNEPDAAVAPAADAA
ncbi:hypothetical protein OG989_04270 [Micromonospora sp. NBC_01740]|uniref:hypothetical protein n=1 Tax=Micromonospora sp. NBC_01740 TaxID=2975986 RepID=UPI002E1538E7|nr:hypothetical protein OG989_04270 [Micromonospora sp. NBC_01740]